MRSAAALPIFLLFSSLLPSAARSSQGAVTAASAQAATTYPDTPEGLQNLVSEIIRAIKAKQAPRRAELIHGLLIPENSTWFIDEYGPGFGASLGAGYQRAAARLEQEIKAVYEADAERGWTTPKILRYADPDAVKAPLDHFLNCMNQIVPLYTAAFQGGAPTILLSLKPGENGKQAAGDLDGFFTYDRGGFRFIPYEILTKLPNERPVRIALDMTVMESKLTTKAPGQMPQEALKKRIGGRVVVQLVLDVSGNIKELKVLEGNPILSAAVLDVVKQWRFAPTRQDGDPVEVDLRVPFSLTSFSAAFLCGTPVMIKCQKEVLHSWRGQITSWDFRVLL